MSQSVTPELRQWIVDQALVGHQPEAVLGAMVQAGWTEDVAEVALEDTLRDHLRQRASGKPVAPVVAPVQATAAQGVRVPDVDLSVSSGEVDVGDRRVQVVASLQSRRVLVLGGLLSG